MTANQLCLWWPIANSNPTEPGSVGQGIRTAGWRGFVAADVLSAIGWCEASGVRPAIELHLPFGHWRAQMHLDAWDFARHSGHDWLLRDFAAAWRPIAARAELVGYVGSIGVHPDLVAQPPEQLAETIRRNVRPLLSAGFTRIVVDHASTAIRHGFTNDKTGERHERSLDAFELDVIDALLRDEYGLSNRTEIEAAPPNFREWRELAKRDCWMIEPFYALRFAPFPATPDGERKQQAALDRGWGTAKHLTGRVHRMIRAGEASAATGQKQTPQEALAIAQRIVRAGHIPAVPAELLMGAGIKAAEIFTQEQQEQ
jgi:hypothetical protein